MVDTHALPFVTVDDDGQFAIAPEAVELLRGIKGKLVIVSVAGLYRTGKSFLLNLLVGGNGTGFSVGRTVNACTKGIWIWGQPIELEDGSTLLYIDTEGLGSTERGQTHDARIFSLALLLSSHFIYNSRGVINGNAIEDLSLVINLTKHIQTSTRSDNDGSDLHEFFPTLLWVVRDFTLQLEQQGKKITPKQYLENALKPQTGFSEDAATKNQVRMLLTNFFRKRDCVTLVRPAEEEAALKDLSAQPYDTLRPEFRSTFEAMKKKLIKNMQPKMLYGKLVNGAMFANLATTYVEAFNTGKAPVISSAWGRVMQTQCEEALEETTKMYSSTMEERVVMYQPGDEQKQDPNQDPSETTAVSDAGKHRLTGVDAGHGHERMCDEFGNIRRVEKGDRTVAVGSAVADDVMAGLDVGDCGGSVLQSTPYVPEKLVLPVDAHVLSALHNEVSAAASLVLQNSVQDPDVLRPYKVRQQLVVSSCVVCSDVFMFVGVTVRRDETSIRGLDDEKRRCEHGILSQPPG
jgi:hypothetical protein